MTETLHIVDLVKDLQFSCRKTKDWNSVMRDRYESVEGGINMQEGPVCLIWIDITNPRSLRTKVTVTKKVSEKN